MINSNRPSRKNSSTLIISLKIACLFLLTSIKAQIASVWDLTNQLPSLNPFLPPVDQKYFTYTIDQNNNFLSFINRLDTKESTSCYFPSHSYNFTNLRIYSAVSQNSLLIFGTNEYPFLVEFETVDPSKNSGRLINCVVKETKLSKENPKNYIYDTVYSINNYLFVNNFNELVDLYQISSDTFVKKNLDMKTEKMKRIIELIKGGSCVYGRDDYYICFKRLEPPYRPFKINFPSLELESINFEFPYKIRVGAYNKTHIMGAGLSDDGKEITFDLYNLENNAKELSTKKRWDGSALSNENVFLNIQATTVFIFEKNSIVAHNIRTNITSKIPIAEKYAFKTISSLDGRVTYIFGNNNVKMVYITIPLPPYSNATIKNKFNSAIEEKNNYFNLIEKGRYKIYKDKKLKDGFLIVEFFKEKNDGNKNVQILDIEKLKEDLPKLKFSDLFVLEIIDKMKNTREDEIVKLEILPNKYFLKENKILIKAEGKLSGTEVKVKLAVLSNFKKYLKNEKRTSEDEKKHTKLINNNSYQNLLEANYIYTERKILIIRTFYLIFIFLIAILQLLIILVFPVYSSTRKSRYLYTLCSVNFSCQILSYIFMLGTSRNRNLRLAAEELQRGTFVEMIDMTRLLFTEKDFSQEINYFLRVGNLSFFYFLNGINLLTFGFYIFLIFFAIKKRQRGLANTIRVGLLLARLLPNIIEAILTLKLFVDYEKEKEEPHYQKVITIIFSIILPCIYLLDLMMVLLSTKKKFLKRTLYLTAKIRPEHIYWDNEKPNKKSINHEIYIFIVMAITTSYLIDESSIQAVFLIFGFLGLNISTAGQDDNISNHKSINYGSMSVLIIIISLMYWAKQKNNLMEIVTLYVWFLFLVCILCNLNLVFQKYRILKKNRKKKLLTLFQEEVRNRYHERIFIKFTQKKDKTKKDKLKLNFELLRFIELIKNNELEKVGFKKCTNCQKYILEKKETMNDFKQELRAMQGYGQLLLEENDPLKEEVEFKRDDSKEDDLNENINRNHFKKMDLHIYSKQKPELKNSKKEKGKFRFQIRSSSKISKK